MISRLYLLGLGSLLFTHLLADGEEIGFEPVLEHIEEEMAVVPEALPRLPDDPIEHQDTVLHDQLNGIVLVGDRSDMLRNYDLDNFQGVETIDLMIPGGAARLERELCVYLNQPLTRLTIRDIKYTISEYYRDNNYPLVVVEVPEQDITSGVLQLVILEGRLGKVSVQGNCYFSSQRLRNYIDLMPNDPICERGLIRDLNFINRNPFRRVDVVYSPGEDVGTTDLTLMVDDRRPLRFYAGVENNGVPSTSRSRWLAGFNWGNAFWLDHILAYQFTASYKTSEFFAHTLQYIAPLPWHHVFNVYGGYSRVSADLPIPNMRNTGRSYQASGRYSIPLPPSRALYHEFTIGYDWKRTNNTIEFSDTILNFGKNVNISQFLLGYSGNYERPRYRLDFGLDAVFSPGKMMSDQSKEDYESLREGADNDWVYGVGQFVYLQRLPQDFSLSLLFKGQLTYQNLLPSEQFYLGGYDTVRGYDQRQVNSDNGILLSGELRSPAVQILKHFKARHRNVRDAFQALIFLDYGWGINHDAIPGFPKSEWLMGAGPGVRYTIDPYLTARLDWGVKLHKQAAFGGGNTEVHFAVTASY